MVDKLLRYFFPFFILQKFFVSSLATAPVELSKVGNSTGYFLYFIFLQIQFQSNLVKFWVNFLEIQKNANGKKQRKSLESFGKFYIYVFSQIFSQSLKLPLKKWIPTQAPREIKIFS